MKRIISVILMILILCSCELTRDSYYTFYFDDYSITPGYDDMEYMRLVFNDNLPDKIDKNDYIENVDIYFWDRYFSSVDVRNYYSRKINSDKAVVTRLDFYLDNEPDRSYRIDDIELSDSITQNCEAFKGKLFENDYRGCVFGKRINDQDNVVILYADYLDLDKDKLHRIEIYVK